jgi:hypothetical protein
VAPERGALRLIRVGLFALTAVGLAGAAHLIGGETIAPIPALIAVPAVMVVINLLGSARRGPATLLVAMGVTQIVLHTAFMAVSVVQGCHTVSPAMTGMANSPDHRGIVVSCGSEMGHGGVLGGLWPSATMLIAHALAGVLLALLLAHGESVVWALAAALRFGFVLPGPVLARPVARRLPVVAAIAFRPRSSVLRRGVRRRGPPVTALAVF